MYSYSWQSTSGVKERVWVGRLVQGKVVGPVLTTCSGQFRHPTIYPLTIPYIWTKETKKEKRQIWQKEKEGVCALGFVYAVERQGPSFLPLLFFLSFIRLDHDHAQSRQTWQERIHPPTTPLPHPCLSSCIFTQSSPFLPSPSNCTVNTIQSWGLLGHHRCLCLWPW